MKTFTAIALSCFVLFFGFIIYWESSGRANQEPQTEMSETSETAPPKATAPPKEIHPAPENQAKPKPSMSENLETLLVPTTEFLVSNGELQHYVPQQAVVSGQDVFLTAIQEDDHYLSGKVESNFSFLYGDFAFRIRPVRGDGLFPAVWMLPASGSALPELDIYESIGNTPDQFNGVLHFMKDNIQDREYFTHYFDPIPESYVLRFHWEKEKAVWYLNDEEIYTITENVPQKPMYLIMNLAVGGNWAKAPTDNSIFPARYRFEVLQFEPQNVGSR